MLEPCDFLDRPARVFLTSHFDSRLLVAEAAVGKTIFLRRHEHNGHALGRAVFKMDFVNVHRLGLGLGMNR